MKDIDKPPIRCTHCGKWFYNRLVLFAHIQKLHSPQSDRFGTSILAPITKSRKSTAQK